MNLTDLLACHSLLDAQLLVHPNVPETRISGFNVLEATDIERWGRPGIAVLSSYYALQHVSKDELEEFFRKLAEIPIAVLMIKVDRLLDHIPPTVISLCEQHAIPLIRLDRRHNYQDIITEVLGSILARREEELRHFYDVSAISSKLTLEMSDINRILKEFASMLGMELAIHETNRDIWAGTSNRLRTLRLGDRLAMTRTEYMSKPYERFSVLSDEHVDEHTPSAIVIDTSCVSDRVHVLHIYEPPSREFGVHDVVIIENLIRCIQISLMREYAGRQQNRLVINSVIGHMLHGRLDATSELETVLRSFEIASDEQCRVLSIEIARDPDASQPYEMTWRERIQRRLSHAFPRSIYHFSHRTLEFVIPIRESDRPVSARKLEDLISEGLSGSNLPVEIRYYGGLSEKASILEIGQAGMQANAIGTFMRTHHKANCVQDYNDLGIFKILVESGQGNMERFVSRELRALHAEHASQYETLRAYLLNNQSLQATAKDLDVHPKTVKYRVDKLRDTPGVNLADPREMAALLTGIEIIDFQEGA